MHNESSTETPALKLRELIADMRVTMFTTLAADGTFHTRPMAALKSTTLDELWFLTASDSAKTDEIDATHCVGLSYADPAKQRFVAVCGSAHIVRDPATARALWQPAFAAWFPDGPDDPNLRLVCVTPHKAEYWDSSSRRMALLFQTVKAVLGGKKPQFSSEEHAKVDLHR